MPAGDGTGPVGMGPMTGRRAGYCAGFDVPGYANSIPGSGLGLRWGHGRAWSGGGRGRRWRHWYHATGLPAWARFGCAPAWGAPAPYGPYAAAPTREQQVGALREQAEWLKQQLEAIGQRIAEFEKEA